MDDSKHSRTGNGNEDVVNLAKWALCAYSMLVFIGGAQYGFSL